MPEESISIASFNNYLTEKKLMGSRCPKCGSMYLPPRPLCLKCTDSKTVWIQTKGTGTLAAYTIIAVGTPDMVQQGYTRNNPYITGIVQIDEGPKISARITNVDPKGNQLKIGMPLTVDFIEQKPGSAQRVALGFKPV